MTTSIDNLILKNRCYRRFNEKKKISEQTIIDMIDLARLCPCSRNIQPLRYKIILHENERKKLFPLLGWANYLDDWKGPVSGERPAGYVIVMGDTDLADSFDVDAGMAIQSIRLIAMSRGLGSCVIAAFDANKMKNMLDLPRQLKVLYVIPMGEPKEEVKLSQVGVEGDFRYYRDEGGVHFVPKRKLEDIIIK